MNKKYKIKKHNYSRIVCTETIPNETPIIFSNDGLYKNIVATKKNNISNLLVDSLIFGTFFRNDIEALKEPSSTIPYSYKIRKNSNEFRRLSIIHPLSQWKIKEFYEKYESLIIYLCTLSPASIRFPKKVANTFYNKASWENMNQYRHDKNISEVTTDNSTKHSPTYFAYNFYNRLYKFFDSRDYFNLEKNFQFMWSLDVSKCFDSIYTHCLCWAVKDKNFIKKHVEINSTFSQKFDEVIRHANHNETNGIIIGPEVSRIFSEIIFQKIDKTVILKLYEKHSISFDKEYSFRRYVDDIFIFSKDESTAKKVYECYSDVLLTFNLHVNTSKSVKILRPFITKKSRIIRELSKITNDFLEKFLETSNDVHKIIPKKIHFKWKLTKNFIDTIKSICSYNDVNYDEISNYLISIYFDRIKKLVNVKEDEIISDTISNYKDSILVILDIMFFLYSVSPSVSSSYKLCASIIILSRFSEKHIKIHSETIKQKIFDLSHNLLSSNCINNNTSIENFISLESINILLSIRELGENYLIPEKCIFNIFPNRNVYSYYEIISCLFYIRNDDSYKNIKNEIILSIDNKLSDLSDIFINTEKAHLFLDVISCPYISSDKKEKLVKNYYKFIHKDAPSQEETTNFFASSNKTQWFTGWVEIDLLNQLEKKELNKSY